MEFELLFSPDYAPPEEAGETYLKNGLLHCSACHTPRQTRMQIPNLGERIVRCRCSCEAQAEQVQKEKDRREKFAMQMERMRTDNISDLSYERCSFSVDDRLDEQSFGICRRYVDNWAQMRQNNMGILFYGTVGSGKTFRASCIASALWDLQVPATVTSFPRLLNLLQDSRDRQGLLDQLNRYELVVIDDLGVERDSAYALEQIYNIVDSRCKAGKPLVVTTNLSLQDLKNPTVLFTARITRLSSKYLRSFLRILFSLPSGSLVSIPRKRLFRAFFSILS